MAEASRFRGYTHQNNVRCAKRPRRYYRAARIMESSNTLRGNKELIFISTLRLHASRAEAEGMCFQGESKRVQRKKIEGAGTFRFLRPLSIEPQSFYASRPNLSREYS